MHISGYLLCLFSSIMHWGSEVFLVIVTHFVTSGHGFEEVYNPDDLDVLQLNFNEEDNHLFTLSRHVRQTEQDEYAETVERNMMCCQIKRDPKRARKERNWEEERKIRKTCEALAPQNASETSEERLNKMTCYVDCSFKKHNATDSSGNILLDEAMTFLEDEGLSGELILDKVKLFCGNYSSEMTSKDAKKYTCPRQSLHFMLCTKDIIHKFCPEEMWNRRNIDDCEKLKEKLKDEYNE
ncbi:uncharacterized protein [Periplaneta americana]|uniref:uncharacterized protein n=1 Tax=Periplaneta americana TaxID=6978 RepID=UPI0037E85C55